MTTDCRGWLISQLSCSQCGVSWPATSSAFLHLGFPSSFYHFSPLLNFHFARLNSSVCSISRFSCDWLFQRPLSIFLCVPASKPPASQQCRQQAASYNFILIACCPILKTLHFLTEGHCFYVIRAWLCSVVNRRGGRPKGTCQRQLQWWINLATWQECKFTIICQISPSSPAAVKWLLDSTILFEASILKKQTKFLSNLQS